MILDSFEAISIVNSTNPLRLNNVPTIDQWSKAFSVLLSELDNNKKLLAEYQAKETGKPIRFCVIEIDRCKAQVKQAIDYICHSSELDSSDNTKRKRVPIGRVLAITTFSSPYSSLFHKLLPSVLCNNILLICVSPLAYNCSKWLFELICKCFLPIIDDIEQRIFFASKNITAKSVVDLYDFQCILFTGKTETASSIKKNIGYKRGVFETGSNALAYVDNSCSINLETVAKKLVNSAFAQSGQRCIGLKNLFINAEVSETLISLIVEYSSKLSVGDPMLEETIVGPLFAESLNCLRESINELELHGYKRILGNIINDTMVSPVVLIDECATIPSVQELYGPVLCIHIVDNIYDIGAEYWKRSSLSTSCYAEDSSVINDFICYCNSSGNICINCGPDYRNDSLPFGGLYDENDRKEDLCSLIGELSHEQYIYFNE